MNKFDKAFNNELVADIFMNAVLSNLCGIVSRIYKKGATTPETREEQIAFIYLNSNLSIAHLIDCLNKEDVLVDAGWGLDDKGIWFDSQDLEDGYNRATAEVKAMFAGA